MKNKEKSSFYYIEVIFEPKDYASFCFKGFFAPKKDNCQAGKIRDEVLEFIKGAIDFDELEIDPDTVKKRMKVIRMPYDFVIKEK